MSTIYLDITTGTDRSTIELSLSRRDIEELYDKEFEIACRICRGKMGNSANDAYICCDCLLAESRKHADCCLAEERG